jgi:hypothetical protein
VQNGITGKSSGSSARSQDFSLITQGASNPAVRNLHDGGGKFSRASQHRRAGWKKITASSLAGEADEPAN